MYVLYIDISPSDFDAIEELHGGLGALRLPPPQPTSHEYGAYLRQQRQQREARKPLHLCRLHHSPSPYFSLQCSNSISCNMGDTGHTQWAKRYMQSIYILYNSELRQSMCVTLS